MKSSIKHFRYRKTYNVIIKNVPDEITQDDINKKFTPYGEILTLYLKVLSNTKNVIIKFLCEPDAEKVIQDYNGRVWGSNIVLAERLDKTRHQVASSENSDLNFPPCEVNKIYPWAEEERSTIRCCNLVRQIPEPLEMLKIPDFRPLVCTFVEDCVTFYGQTLDVNQGNPLEDKLQKICPILKRVKNEPSVSEIYAVLYGDSLWYRCVVLKCDSVMKKAVVKYIDFGNTEEKYFTSLVCLPKSISLLPPLVSKCVLTRVKCLENASQNGIEFLRMLINEKKILIKTLSPVKSRVYEVLECYIDSFNVVNELLNERIVVPKNDSNNFRSKECNDVDNNFESFHLKTATTNYSECDYNEIRCSKLTSENFIGLMGDLDFWKNETSELLKKCKVLEKALSEKESSKTSLNCQECAIVSELEMVLSAIQDVKQLRRDFVVKSDADVLDAFSMLLYKNESTKNSLEIKSKDIENELVVYNSSLDQIVQCTDKLALEGLVQQKDFHRRQLLDKLKEHNKLLGTSIYFPVITSREKLKELIEKLQNKLKSSVDKKLNNQNSSIQDVMMEYNSTVADLKSKSNYFQNETDKLHDEFFTKFSGISKLFSLAPEDESKTGCSSTNSRKSFIQSLSSDTFKSSLMKFKTALNEESNFITIHLNTINESETSCTLIEYLVYELKKMLDLEVENNKDNSYYQSLCEELFDISKILPDKLFEINNVKIKIKLIKKKFRHAVVDLKELQEEKSVDHEELAENNKKIKDLQIELQKNIIEEDKLISELAAICRKNYPELDILNPELGLTNYVKYNGLYKETWKLDYFIPSKSYNKNGIIVHESIFASNLIIIKEIYLKDLDDFLIKSLKWNTLSSPFLVPVQAIFTGDNHTVCIMLPKKETLKEQLHIYSKLSCYNILKDILKGIISLHEAYIYHGMLKLSTVLIEDGTISFDFCLGETTLDSELGKDKSKFSQFQSEAKDIKDFACLVLMLLVPKLKLPLSLENLLQQQSMIEDILNPECFTVLLNCLSSAQERIPSAETLLNCSFFQSVKESINKKKD